MEAAPPAPFIVPKSDLLLELLIVALDAPAQLGKVDELAEADIRWQRRQPILGRRGFARGPLDQQPLLRQQFRHQSGYARPERARGQSATITNRLNLPAIGSRARHAWADHAPPVWPRSDRVRRDARYCSAACLLRFGPAVRVAIPGFSAECRRRRSVPRLSCRYAVASHCHRRRPSMRPRVTGRHCTPTGSARARSPAWS